MKKWNKKTTKYFIFYAVMIMTLSMGVLPVHAEGDPLTVVNNLSNFIFGFDSCSRYDFTWFWCRSSWFVF